MALRDKTYDRLLIGGLCLAGVLCAAVVVGEIALFGHFIFRAW